MLYGRSAEIAALDEVVARARDGSGGAVVLRGTTGAGKTALLDAAAARGGAMRVLRTTGVESERDLAFAALHQALRPVTGSLDALPEPQRAVEGLSESAAARLLEPRCGGAAARVVRELVMLTRANPLALSEVAARLTRAQLAGREPLPDPLPGGTRLFGDRVAALSAPARLLALASAVETDLGLVLRATDRLFAEQALRPGTRTGPDTRARAATEAGAGTGTGRVALAELEESGLAGVSGTSVRFRHPLIRSAVYESATPAAVRHMHAVLAELTTDDRRAWHLAEATLGQDEQVAAALVAAAERARDRGGYGAAATAMARAAELTPEPRARAVRLKDAAVAAWLGGRPGQAESLLAEAREHAGGDAPLAMEIARLQGRFELNSGNAAEAVRILSAGESLDLLADASEAASYVGDTAAVVELGRRAAAHPEGFLRDTVAGIGLTLDGDAAGPGLLRRALARVGELEGAAEHLWAAAAASYLGEPDLAAEMAGRAGRVARVSGMSGQLPVVLEFVATGDRLAGRLARSQAVSEEGLALAREAGYENSVAAHLANLAVLAALRGEEEPCERQAREALAIAIPHRAGLRAGVASYALALLDLCLGRFAAAHDRFTAIVAAGPGAGHPTVVWRTTTASRPPWPRATRRARGRRWPRTSSGRRTAPRPSRAPSWPVAGAWSSRPRTPWSRRCGCTPTRSRRPGLPCCWVSVCGGPSGRARRGRTCGRRGRRSSRRAHVRGRGARRTSCARRARADTPRPGPRSTRSPRRNYASPAWSPTACRASRSPPSSS
ncbi:MULTISPECIES: ATP-binding protein [unclassified Nonomuraea]|uniref:ATP-binding protein n=1 Tax=unclassified Nonomuraea TaxID=2593643 RepID=UPI00207BA1E4|nr:ATP-binding protein [Nonomuraea sp. KC401]